ncbi:hypothetical protein RHMOL_Rhmol08G0217000 [Rhododendron molle]|uniref:Uncharacterized protein n=1 Tax=Rhododendron molle TaxID=49168 RepID=A0ACC0MT21_RHOML|nr:hypothetical protein RHMOL_Rhmol08G0217000 [Rhododendron molle]
MIEKLGYLGLLNYYYVMTGKNINNGLRMLLTDSDVIEMIDQLSPSRIVDMYAEPVTPIQMIEIQIDKGGPTPTPTPTPTPSRGTPTPTPIPSRATPTLTPTHTLTDKGVSTNTNKGVPTKTNKGCAKDKGGPIDKGGPSHEVNNDDFLVDDTFFEGRFSDGVGVQDLGDTTSDSDVSFEVDSDYEQSNDDGLYEANVDEETEWVGQASSSRGRGFVVAASQGGQALTSRGRGGGERGRGRTNSGRRNGDGRRGRGDGGRARGFGNTS